MAVGRHREFPFILLLLDDGYGRFLPGRRFADAADVSFTFTTVRGGRHEVPETAPFKALAMITRFTSLKGFGKASREEL